MTTPIFDIEKTVNAALYVAHKINRKDFHKIFKILYFADREHLSLYGRVITGDTYVAMNDGPVPTMLYDIFKGLRGDSIYAQHYQRQFSKCFEVENKFYIKPQGVADMDCLSESDVEELDKAIAKYGDMSWDEVREKSHDIAWRSTAKDDYISLENIMLENGESSDYVEFVTEQIRFQKQLNASAV